MARNYDDYGYEENKYRTSNVGLVRKILIVLMVIVAILLIIYLLKGCSKAKKPNVNPTPDINNNTVKYDYEANLLLAGKKYYSSNSDELPNSPGECSIVELETLLSKEMIDADKFGSCNVNTTYVKVCKLEDTKLQYTPWLTCVDETSNTAYSELKEGNASQVIPDETYVEFKFLPQVATSAGQILGKVEEMWKDDIDYESYKTLASTKYYRYRDKLFTWKLITRNYYTSYGIKNKASAVSEYYATAPNSNYKLYSD